MATTKKKTEPKPTRADHEDALIDALRELLGPKAVAAMAVYLRAFNIQGLRDHDVIRQVNWFQNLLIEMVGGNEEWWRICKELGL